MATEDRKPGPKEGQPQGTHQNLPHGGMPAMIKIVIATVCTISNLSPEEILLFLKGTEESVDKMERSQGTLCSGTERSYFRCPGRRVKRRPGQEGRIKGVRC